MSPHNALGALPVEDLGHAAALLCAATWAFATVVFGRIAQTVEARTLNFVKTAFSALLLVITALLVGDVPRVSAADLGALLVSAVFGLLVADTAYFVALRELGPARGVVFVSLIPVCTALLASVTLGEPLTGRMFLGMALTLGGVTLVVRTPLPHEHKQEAGPRRWLSRRWLSRGWLSRGAVAGIVYCVAQAAANVLTKGTDPSLSPLALSALRMGMGGALLGVWLLVPGGARPRFDGVRAAARGLALGSFVGTYVGVLLGTFALRTVSAGVATTLVATTPLFALAFAWIAGERPRLVGLLGASMALAGVAVLVL